MAFDGATSDEHNLGVFQLTKPRHDLIPRIIHTSWISGDPYPKVMQQCLDSWRRVLPEYEIKIWSAKNWDVNRWVFTREAYEHEQWAFVSDVQRLDVLHRYGGIYLDMDVEVRKPLDRFLSHEYFTGSEREWGNNTPYIFGCKARNGLVKELLDFYDDKHFVSEDGTFVRTTNTSYIHKILEKHGLCKCDVLCEFKPNHVRYPSWILGHDHEEAYAVHLFQGTWRTQPSSVKVRDKRQRVAFFNKSAMEDHLGSTPEYTKDYRIFLSDYLRENKITSVLDIGCGKWQFSQLIDWSGISYLGVDISSAAINENKTLYEAKNIKFQCLDVIEDDLPGAQLVIAKDFLQHLSNGHILKIFEKLKKFETVLFVHDFYSKVHSCNQDITEGDYRPVDVRKPPFSLVGCKKLFSFVVGLKTGYKFVFEWKPMCEN